MNAKRKALVVLSGGQDSTTCLFWAIKHFDEVHAITFDYNQRHRRELAAAANVGHIAGVASHTVVTLGPILMGRSPLTDPNAKLETYSDHASMEQIIGDRVELTFVPMRNALFLTLAANAAICKDISSIVTGVCQADNANYPDCRESFIESQQATINEALGALLPVPIRILTPLMDLSKDVSVHLARQLGPRAFAALAFSHTAYDGNYPPLGNDHASVLRAHGFHVAGLPDPLIVRAVLIDKVMPAFPPTSNYSSASTLIQIQSDIEQIMQQYAGVLQ